VASFAGLAADKQTVDMLLSFGIAGEALGWSFQ